MKLLRYGIPEIKSFKVNGQKLRPQVEGYKWEETILPLKDFERKELMQGQLRASDMNIYIYIYSLVGQIFFPLILIFAFVSNKFD